MRCPACGKGRLFSGLLTIAPECSECHLSYKGIEVGDGPAFFAICIVGTLVAVFATIVEVKFQPPFWVHAVLWVPFVIIGSLLCLRYLKAALIAAQYRLRKHDFTN